MVYLKSVENVTTLGKLIGLLFLFCLPLLSILFLKTPKMKSTKVLTLSSVCKQTLITFSIVNFILSLDLLNIVNIFINIAYDHDMIKVMH